MIFLLSGAPESAFEDTRHSSMPLRLQLSIKLPASDGVSYFPWNGTA